MREKARVQGLCPDLKKEKILNRQERQEIQSFHSHKHEENIYLCGKSRSHYHFRVFRAFRSFKSLLFLLRNTRKTRKISVQILIFIEAQPSSSFILHPFPFSAPLN